MSESLNTRSMIFTLYGEYIRHYGNEIWIGSLIRLLKEFGHNDQSVRAAISRMSKQGWVESRKEGNKSFYYLTERGSRRMDEAAQRIFKLRPTEWDGKWRMFLYTIPEEKRHIRDELRKELVWSGFGSSSASLWLSPNHLEEQVKWLIDKYEINEYVHFFIADYKGPHENHALVNECWDLTEISARYREFIKKYSERYIIDRSKIENGKMSDGECFVERAKLVHEFRKFLFIDPGLPSKLLPDEWPGDHAAMLFSDYYKTLAQPASRFFEEVFREGNELTNKDRGYDALNHPLLSERQSN
ncbi:phenylacetic acid degradation operon negative regulatory protein PaaX [Guptibacillus spartinae]|uniref:phenylacetic acid degradation operon negative regulatory protein PaaX n=1 Tax=Guptibacillus spartinae TaxID=3025679 RepID=UPI002362DEDA|nr:phenylacetic acid degradation operon negative regulatory protein PaaX [Pseudalkalibacillus spartinae]